MSRWDSRLHDLMLMQERMNRLFEESLQRGGGAVEEAVGALWTPAVDIFETESELVLIAEIPGVEREDVRVDLDGHRLTLRGERRFTGEVDREKYHRIERPYGAFSRSFDLPPAIAAEMISAEYRNGLLTIRMPKQSEERSKQIDISIG